MKPFVFYLKSPSRLFLWGAPRWTSFLVPLLMFIIIDEYRTDILKGFFGILMFESYLIIGWTICFIISKLNVDMKDVNGNRLYITDTLMVPIVGGLFAVLGILIFDKLRVY